MKQWELFQKTVGNETLNSHHQIPELAVRVALESNGAPLALINIGRTMAGNKNPHEWKRAIKLLTKSASDRDKLLRGTNLTRAMVRKRWWSLDSPRQRYVVKTLDNAESVKLQYPSLAKVSNIPSLTTMSRNFNEVAYPRPLALAEDIPIRSPIVGMDSMLENVWRYITEEEQVRIIGIYGKEGLGKTTLLTIINHEFLRRVNHDFDVVIWVKVSKESNVRRVQKDIAKRLGLKPEDEINDAAFARLIFNVLKKKKFVLLLDDIWDRVDFEDVGVPCPNSTNKCKVVFTTRSVAVCRLMEAQKNLEIECLGWSEAWDLFQKTVVGGKDTLSSHRQIPELAARVDLEWDGIPLALISIGRGSKEDSP
ncbi:hypothetical protein HHK36_032596 [Tetracentron sinense]|uniref:AAA+ ATPase domain-containing protein n=1 Tax=Tetracentron sinense TaxID=13715 RepID=A0A834YA18_TETSI|nr:hypothetical protein HHK36_032596 [Tetracentron sinense]